MLTQESSSGLAETFADLDTDLEMSLLSKVALGVNSSMSLLEFTCKISVEGQGLNFSVH